MINTLLAKVETTLKRYKKSLDKVQLDRYYRAFKTFNTYGQGGVYKITLDNGSYMYMTVSTLQDANDKMRLQFPGYLVEKKEPIQTLRIYKAKKALQNSH